ncbi:MAG: hypothetical protein QXF61_09280 [Nitrososphaeria archaeon]
MTPKPFTKPLRIFFLKRVVRVIVINNNSSDDTAIKAMKTDAIVVHEKSQGYGFACIGLKEALCFSDADVIVLAGGDINFIGRDFWKLLPYLEDVDIAIGSRTHAFLTCRDS